jgi:uncharacterized membrane protein (DUF4010 family)
VKLVSIEVSLTIWSLFIFGIQAISLLSVLLVFLNPNNKAVLFIILLWMISQITYILYGYSTKQIGFLLLGIFNIIVSFVALFLNFGKAREEEEDEEDGEKYED